MSASSIPALSTTSAPPGTAWPVATLRSKPPMLWSASNRVAHKVSIRFFGYHYVWCTPTFEGGALGRYAVGAGQPPSSDPASIYRKLHAAVAKKDEHDDAVLRHRTAIANVAFKLSANGRISDYEAQEAVAFIEASHVTDWVPLLYAIPYNPVAGRLLAVPRAERASDEPEYVIPDLAEGEFDVIEPWPCL